MWAPVGWPVTLCLPLDRTRSAVHHGEAELQLLWEGKALGRGTMDSVPLISPLDVSQLQPSFTDQVRVLPSLPLRQRTEEPGSFRYGLLQEQCTEEEGPGQARHVTRSAPQHPEPFPRRGLFPWSGQCQHCLSLPNRLQASLWPQLVTTRAPPLAPRTQARDLWPPPSQPS